MRLAGLLGLNVAKTDICHIENVPFLKVSRYDRKKLENRIEKLHQEDFCQATGTVSSKKYQKEGGPSFRECLNIIREHSNIAGKDSISILKWLVFNILICNHDGHAKNISLLHDENEGIRLAPFYDLLCTGIYPMLSSEMAMRIGKVYDWSKIRRSDLNELTGKVKIKKRLINTIIDQMCDEIVSESEKLINRLTNNYGDIKIYEKIRDMIRIGVDNLA